MTAKKPPGTAKRRGRPSAYRESHPEAAKRACDGGATDAELAEMFGVHVSTIYRWQVEYPDFCEALKAAKAPADDRVERSLYHRAVGYSYPAVKIFMPAGATKPVYAAYIEHVPPDTTAGIFWLKNRRPGAWRDKQEVEHTGAVQVTSVVRRVVDPAIGEGLSHGTGDRHTAGLPAIPEAGEVQGG